MKILFVASEGLPYSKTGGLADVVEALPKALRAMGHDVAVLLPRYHANKIHSMLISSVTVALGDRLRFPAIAEAEAVDGVRYFFVDDPPFFDRPELYGDSAGDYPDNAERFAEFSRVTIEFMKRVWLPDVVHCHDWQTALVPVLLRTQHAEDRAVRSLPVVFTIHNLAYQGVFEAAALRRIGLPDALFSVDALEFFGKVNFLKGGLIYADYLTTVSRRYAKEIQTAEYRLRARRRDPPPSRPADRHLERCRLHGVESGGGQADRAELLGARISTERRRAKRICSLRSDCRKTTWRGR